MATKLTKSAERQVAIARSLLATNPGYYARTLSALQRSLVRPQGIFDAIREDDTGHLFVELQNGCLIAAEGI